jgi:hypothetical protein
MQPGISRKRRRGLVLDDTVGLKKRYFSVEITVAVQVSLRKTLLFYKDTTTTTMSLSNKQIR